MHILKKPMYDIKWIYDTPMQPASCIAKLIQLPESNPYLRSGFSCSQLSDRQVEIVLKQPKSGEGRPKRTRYIAEFYPIENGQTVIVLRFVDELFWMPPFTPIEEMDGLFLQILHASRRK